MNVHQCGISLLSGPHTYGKVWWRKHDFVKKGDKHFGHKHAYDHVTCVCVGGVLCEIEGEDPKEYKAGDIIQIAAELRHKFTALEDGSIYYCIFAEQDGQEVGCASCGVGD